MKANQDGNTLVEVMVAASLMVVGLLGVAGLFGRAMRENLDSGQMTAEYAYAQEKLEALLTTGTGTGPGALTAGTYQDTAPGGLVRTWVIVANNPAPNTRTVVVTVARPGAPAGHIARLVAVRAQ